MSGFFSGQVFLALVQLGMLIAVAWTLYVLIGYARDTKRMAEASVLQQHLMHRPCVVVQGFKKREGMHIAWDQAETKFAAEGTPISPGHPPGNPSVVELDDDFRLLNTGLGPAFEIEVRKVDADGKEEYRVFIPHLKQGEAAPIGLEIKYEAEELWKLRIEYLGLSGARFVSSYSLEGAVVRGFETMFKDLGA